MKEALGMLAVVLRLARTGFVAGGGSVQAAPLTS
jgi:hypothetical protein